MAKREEAEAKAEEAKLAKARDELTKAREALAKAEEAFADGAAGWPTKEREELAKAEVRAARAERRAEEARAKMLAAKREALRAEYAAAIARCSDEQLKKDLEPGIQKLEQARRIAEEGAAALLAVASRRSAAAADAKRCGEALEINANEIEEAVRCGYVGSGVHATNERGLDAIRKIAAARLGALVAREDLAVSRGSIAAGGRLEAWLCAADPAEIGGAALPFFLEAPGLLARLRG